MVGLLKSMGLKKPKYIIFLSENDWANMSSLLAESVRAVGHEALAITTNAHPYEYPHQAMILQSKEETAIHIGASDVVVFMHSQYLESPMYGQKVFVFHGGSSYRLHSEKVNAFFNQFVDGAIVQTADLLNLGAKNEHWLLPPVDTKSINADYRYHDKTFAHYPRHPAVVGTQAIDNVMDKIEGGYYKKDETTVSWKENIKRMSECDVYIEALVPGYEWGLTALEAASLGKIVITNSISKEMYEKEYGKLELLIANDEEELVNHVKDILTWTPKKIAKKKKATRDWVRKNHSFRAIGRRFMEIVG